MTDRMRAFRARVDAEGWTCPNPERWNALWEMLPDKRRQGSGWEPALPLILAAWWDSPILAKKLRFLEHLDWAETHDAGDDVLDYLGSLSAADWYTS
jgi:hypothetical protein